MSSLQIYNPAAQALPRNKSVNATRVPSLDGKTIGLYDNCKPGGDVAQRRLTEKLTAKFPGIEIRRYTGNIGGRSTLNAAGAKAIVEACDAVVGIRGD